MQTYDVRLIYLFAFLVVMLFCAVYIIITSDSEDRKKRLSVVSQTVVDTSNKLK